MLEELPGMPVTISGVAALNIADFTCSGLAEVSDGLNESRVGRRVAGSEGLKNDGLAGQAC